MVDMNGTEGDHPKYKITKMDGGYGIVSWDGTSGTYIRASDSTYPTLDGAMERMMELMEKKVVIMLRMEEKE